MTNQMPKLTHKIIWNDPILKEPQKQKWKLFLKASEHMYSLWELRRLSLFFFFFFFFYKKIFR